MYSHPWELLATALSHLMQVGVLMNIMFLKCPYSSGSLGFWTKKEKSAFQGSPNIHMIPFIPITTIASVLLLQALTTPRRDACSQGS